jgi:hypothetical protein
MSRVAIPRGAIGWAIFGLVAVTGFLVLVGRVHTPGYFPVLEVHRIAGWALCVVAPIVLAGHLVKTGSKAWLTGMCLALGGILSIQVVGALDFPEPMGFVEQQKQALFESDRSSDFQDATIVGAAVLAILLVGSALLTLVGILSPARDRAMSRWSGAALVLLSAWALAGGAVLHWQPRPYIFGTLTLHSVAGTGTLALLVLHLFAQRAARSNASRFLVAGAGVIWMLSAAAGWWTYYEYEHFRGFRPAKVPDALPVWRTSFNPEEHALAADPTSDWPRVPADRFMGSVSCGATDCHEQNTREWAGSPHRFSASNQFYRSAVQEIIDAEGVQAAVFCANCHDPERALRGTIAADYADGVPESGSDGVSCEVCHGMVGVDGEPPGDPPANARFAVSFDRRYPGHTARMQRNIRLDPRRHRQAFVTNNMTLRATPCQACHRIELKPDVVVQNPTVMVQIFGEGGVACTSCHLPQDSASTYTHRMAGINVDLAHYATGLEEGDLELIQLNATYTRDFLGLRRYRPIDRFDWPQPIPEAWSPEGRKRSASNGVISLSLEAYSEEGGRVLDLRTRTLNISIGHQFPSGPLDLNQVWLELYVAAADGSVIHHVGGLDDRGRIQGEPARLGADELDAEGHHIEKHRIFEIEEIVNRRILWSDILKDRFKIDLPEDVALPLDVRARWLFRRASPEFAEWSLGVDISPLPAHELATATITVDHLKR